MTKEELKKLYPDSPMQHIRQDLHDYMEHHFHFIDEKEEPIMDEKKEGLWKAYYNKLKGKNVDNSNHINEQLQETYERMMKSIDGDMNKHNEDLILTNKLNKKLDELSHEDRCELFKMVDKYIDDNYEEEDEYYGLIVHCTPERYEFIINKLKNNNIEFEESPA